MTAHPVPPLAILGAKDGCILVCKNRLPEVFDVGCIVDNEKPFARSTRRNIEPIEEILRFDRMISI